jgi:hypothetical protein
VKPSRRTQPYRAGARHPGGALTAMTRGRTFGGYNPKDLERRVAMLTRKRRDKRGPRQPRVPR